MISFAPQFSGTVKIKSPMAPFLSQFKQRIESGRLAGQPHWRMRYAVSKFSDHELTFAASTFMSAINVGLNRVTLRELGPNQIEYNVTYRIWAAYCIGLGALLALLGVAFYFLVDIGKEIAHQRVVPDPALNLAIGTAIYWGSIIGWGILWPWVLIALHKSPVRKFLLRVIDEVDAASA